MNITSVFKILVVLSILYCLQMPWKYEKLDYLEHNSMKTKAKHHNYNNKTETKNLVARTALSFKQDAYMNYTSSNRTKVILLGAHDRYSFGDILFEKVVTKLLIDRVGYLPGDLLYGGMISIDMSKYGGNPNIQNMMDLSKLSKREGPFDIVYLGGEVTACTYEKGIIMLSSPSNQKQAKKKKASSCAYMFPKSKLLPPGISAKTEEGFPKNYAILNSLGGSVATAKEDCKVAADTADYISFQNGEGETLFPDSAVMTKRLFGNYITNSTNSPGISSLLSQSSGCYIAVQHKQSTLNTVELANAMDKVANKTNCLIVFFAEGTAPKHDSFSSYENVQDKMNMPSIVFKEENVWSVVFVIAHSRMVISTSLHARIMAFIFQKPRITICSSDERHEFFIKYWDRHGSCTPNAAHISNDVEIALNMKVNYTEVNEIEEKYLKNFDAWSNLLIHRGHEINLNQTSERKQVNVTALANETSKPLHAIIPPFDRAVTNQTSEKKQVNLASIANETSKPPYAIIPPFDRTITKDHTRANRTKVILLGPHDRFNFGDLLFEKVVTKLLIDRAGYLPDELLYGGLISTNMSKYGGNPNIHNMMDLSKLSQSEGPFDIVYLGGEATGCTFEKGLTMLSSSSNQKEAEKNKASSCAYMFPKSILLPPGISAKTEEGFPRNYAILNSLGGSVATAKKDCKVAADTADYISFRNGEEETLFPDSAVMTKRLFGIHINDVTNSPGVSSLLKQSSGCYIAVQHKESTINTRELADAMDNVANATKCLIVFFAAGTAPNHDSFEAYEEVKDMMQMPATVFREENVWSVVFIIAHSRMVISTSLHARIMAFIFQKPRVTLCSTEKHEFFIKHWDGLGSCTSSVESVSYDMNNILNITVNWTQVQEVEEKYLMNFDAWSKLLIERGGKNSVNK